MNLYSAVMLAIDGTLADSSDQVSPNTKKLLNRMERRGIPVVLCSSRPPRYVKDAAHRCDLHSPVVCYSGGLILDEHDTILEDAGIDGASALRFKRFAANVYPDVSVTSWLYDVWLADSLQDPNVRGAVRRQGREAVEGLLENALRSGGHVHKLLCIGPPMQIRELWARSSPLFPNLCAVSAGAGCLEILSAGVSEYTAMKRIQQYYHVAAKQIVVVGDYLVDVEILRRAGLGIATGNAPDAVRQAAARVTASKNEEGIYIALKNLRFRPPEPETDSGPACV